MPGAWHLYRLFCLILAGTLGFAIHSSARAAPEIWFAPPDSIAQPENRDFRDFFLRPQTWQHAATHIKVFSVTSTYLLKAPPEDAQRLLRQLSANGLQLDVSISALTTDKSLCGDGLEGMVWPNEPLETAKHLKNLGADVGSFSLDLPLVAGVLSTAPKACRLTIEETATRLARAVNDLRTIYPMARIVDAEVPTGMPVAQWSALLTKWLSAYKLASGRQFDGFGMDVWYAGNWRPTVLATSQILSRFGVQAGIFVDASEGAALSPAEWISKTKEILCAVEQLNTEIHFYTIANWLNLRVPNLPETDPNSLTALATWASDNRSCPANGKIR